MNLNLIKKIATHKYIALVLRLYIGGLFVYASMYKINYAGEFAASIANYQIVPFWAVNIMALLMPWMELICGLLLVAGIRTHAATIIIMGFLIMFTMAIFINLIRGVQIGCGCFNSLETPMSWLTFLRDLTWVAMTVHIYFFDKAFQLGKLFTVRLKDI